MKLIVYNSRLAKRMLFPGYSTIMLFGIILTKSGKEECPPALIRHEQIHQRQYLECFILPVLPAVLFTPWILTLCPLSFYILYLTEWFISFVRYFWGQGMTDPGRAGHRAYMSSAMEMEAKVKEVETGYLERRKHFAFMRYYDKI